MTPGFDEQFLAAMVKTMEAHEALGHIATEDWQESGDMRAIGVKRADVMKLFHMLYEEYKGDLSEGGSRQATALLAIIEIVLPIGVHLERARWDAHEAMRAADQPTDQEE